MKVSKFVLIAEKAFLIRGNVKKVAIPPIFAHLPSATNEDLSIKECYFWLRSKFWLPLFLCALFPWCSLMDLIEAHVWIISSATYLCLADMQK